MRRTPLILAVALLWAIWAACQSPTELLFGASLAEVQTGVGPVQMDSLAAYLVEINATRQTRSALAETERYVDALRAYPAVNLPQLDTASAMLARVVPARNSVNAYATAVGYLESLKPRVEVPGEAWHRTLRDTTVVGDIVVPAGQAWLIGANVRISGNVRTDSGTIAMRPGSSLTFVGATPAQYVGGGMRYAPEFANDWGIWVGGVGVLDIQGTPKEGWNRTGASSSWLPSDELWIAPTDVGDYLPRRFTAGDSVPQAHELVPPAEVMNATRDIVITGPAHIHISSTVPQRIEYVTLRGLGITRPNGGKEATITGRYALHLHMMGEGSRGTVIQGVAAIGSRGKVFVPHASHGVTLTDNVCIDSWGECFWWDEGEGNETNDVLVDRLAVSGVRLEREVTGVTNRIDGVMLRPGTNMEIRNSAVSGVNSGDTGAAYNWDHQQRRPSVWIFDTGLLAHNNVGPGIRFWNNSRAPHVVADYISYRNRTGGVENGAYRNANRYHDMLLVEDFIVHNTSSADSEIDGGPGRYERVEVYAAGPALTIRHLNLPSLTREEYTDCVLSGSPSIRVQAVSNPLVAIFRDCTDGKDPLSPADIEWPNPMDPELEGSSVIFETRGVRGEVVIRNGRPVIIQ